MIKHIVFFKFIDGLKDSEANILVSKLNNLKSEISLIKSMEIGIDEKPGPKHWDVSLISLFDNYEDLEKYKVHPKHIEIIKYIDIVCLSVTNVDYTVVS